MKKYFQISEVEKLLGTSKSSLRYLERCNKEIKIQKIRGRRYYKYSDIKKIAFLLDIAFDQINFSSVAENSYNYENKRAEKLTSPPDWNTNSLNKTDIKNIRVDLENTRNKLLELLSYES